MACFLEHVLCCSAFHSICSCVALSFPFSSFFTATSPLGHLCLSGCGAAPPCISLFDLVPTASVASLFGCTFFSDASAFTSSRTSYRLLGLGYVVHHSVGKHVRSLLALGYDSLEYFIFYIPLDTLDLVTYFDQQSIFDSISRKLESTRTRTSGQTSTFTWFPA